MDKWETLLKEVQRKGGFNLKEFITRSEGPQLFTTAINDKLIQGLQPEIPDTWNQLYDTIAIDRRDITFPSIRGANPDLVPELAEFKFVDQAYTSITITPQKFGMRLGYSREMLQDNEVGLLGWRAREVGRMHRELKRREAMKAISFFSTGPAVSTGAVGIRNHGVFYPTGGYTNFASGSADSWETRIARAVNQLLTQTITVADMVIQFPVRANAILANPSHQQSIQKVLNASITVFATGVGPAGAAIGNAANVAGTNIFAGLLPIQIFDPTVPTGQAFVLEAKRGLVMVEREGLAVEEMDNFAFDATEMKSRERFLPAVVEERFLAEIQITG